MINKNIKAFSILEVLVWILIFSMWIISVYSVIISTLNLNEYNKNFIIASHLAREQIELVRNIRDSNYEKIQAYNQINPNLEDYDKLFEPEQYYKIENDFSPEASFPISVEKISDFEEWETYLNLEMKNYQLCINDNLYAFCDNLDDDEGKKTQFYKYIRIEKVEYMEGAETKEIEKAFKVRSKVIWYKKWYHEFELISIFTDFKRY